MSNEFAPFQKETTSFVVKNICESKKVIRIFHYPILHNTTRDLLAIPGVGEDDIRTSLLKGEIKRKIDAREIKIIYSNMNLLQFDPSQLSYLQAAGLNYGGKVTKDQLDFKVDIRLDYSWRQKVPLLGLQDGINKVFYTPEKFIEGTYGDNDFHVEVMFNGRQLLIGVDFKISKSNPNTSDYDVITFTSFAPRADHSLYVNYATKVVLQDVPPPATDPPLSIDFTGQTFAEVGSRVINPAFSVNYNRAPQYALLYNPDGYDQQVITGMSEFNSIGSFYRDKKDIIRFSVTAIDSISDVSKSLDLNWVFNTYFGVGVSWNKIIEKDFFIKSLFQELRLPTTKIMNFYSGEDEYIYFAHPKNYGIPKFLSENTNVSFGMLSDGLTIKNNYGISESYYIWSTTMPNLGQTKITVEK